MSEDEGMKVWLVWLYDNGLGDDRGDHRMLGVYSSVEAARAAFPSPSYDVECYEVDALVDPLRL